MEPQWINVGGEVDQPCRRSGSTFSKGRATFRKYGSTFHATWINCYPNMDQPFPILDPPWRISRSMFANCGSTFPIYGSTFCRNWMHCIRQCSQIFGQLHSNGAINSATPYPFLLKPAPPKPSARRPDLLLKPLGILAGKDQTRNRQGSVPNW